MTFNLSYLLALFFGTHNAHALEFNTNFFLPTYGYHKDYLHGTAYLVPKSTDDVEKELLISLRTTSGFSQVKQNEDDYDLSTTWIPLYFYFHPQAFHKLKQERLYTLAKIYKNRSITLEEKSRWSNLIELEQYSPDATDSTIKNIDLKLNRKEWMKFVAGSTGLLNHQFFSREHIVLIDMTSILDKSDHPTTLIWCGGTKTTEKKTGFHLFEELRGVTSIFSPGWDTESIQENHSTLDVSNIIQQLSKKLKALPDSEIAIINLILNKRNNTEVLSTAAVPLRPSKQEVSPNEFVSFFDIEINALKGTETQFSIIPENSKQFLLLVDNSKLYKFSNSKLKLVGKAIKFKANNILYKKVDRNGRMWILDKISGHENTSYKNLYCWKEILVHHISNYQSERCFENILDPVMIEALDGQFYAYCESHMLDSSLNNRLISMKSGSEKNLTSLQNDRLNLRELLPEVLQKISIYSSVPMNLGDQQLWFGTYGGIWGLDPISGYSSKSFNLSGIDFNNKAPIGSTTGDWLSYPLQLNSGQLVHRVIQPSSGKIKFDIEGISQDSMTAHTSKGKWLAVLKENSHNHGSIQIWNMSSGHNFANFVIPDGFRLYSLEFTPDGNILWALIVSANSAQIKLMQISRVHELSTLQ